MTIVRTKRGKRSALPDWAVIKLKAYTRCAGGVSANGEPCGLPEGQKDVLRKEHSMAKSAKLIAFRECIKKARTGKKYGSVNESRSSFASIARSCSAGGAAPAVRGRRARRYPENEEVIEF
jgi:hypothetical protein